jgi:hypothetical protein
VDRDYPPEAIRGRAAYGASGADARPQESREGIPVVAAEERRSSARQATCVPSGGMTDCVGDRPPASAIALQPLADSAQNLSPE